MTRPTSYANGVPNWIDIGSHDLDTTKAFYSQLFGWTAVSAGPEELTGGYGMFQMDGLDVAGFGPAQAEGQWWTSYINVTDIQATAARITDAGGTLLMPPMQVMDAGWMAVCVDPTGAAFSLWQAGEHSGCGIVNEVGSFCWSELLSRDLGAAISFYEAVFGWTHIGGPDAPYTEWQIDGNTIRGAMTMPEMIDASVPSNWQVYFTVENLEDSLARVKELGGAHHMGPMDAGEIGRFVIVGAPGGEVFNLMQFTNAPE